MDDDAMFDRVRFLLLQVRNADDAMRRQEVACFARALGCSGQRIRAFDLLNGAPTRREIDDADIVLLGGSGDYSVAEGGPWLPPAMEAMRNLCDQAKPTFASCWGFQAIAQALGGQVVTDPRRAELGSHQIRLTEAGRDDPIFAPLGESFWGQMGHQDVVERLPPDAILLASTERVANQAFRLADKPIYCTQFHPELNRENLVQRVHAYPQYVESIAGMTLEAFVETCQETPAAESLLRRFVQHVCEIQPGRFT